jgi:hypothetical protein
MKQYQAEMAQRLLNEYELKRDEHPENFFYFIFYKWILGDNEDFLEALILAVCKAIEKDKTNDSTQIKKTLVDVILDVTYEQLNDNSYSFECINDWLLYLCRQGEIWELVCFVKFQYFDCKSFKGDN